MRFKKILFLFSLILIGSSAFLAYETNLYNVVSNEELAVVREKLSALSPQEKKDLTVFFDEAILFAPFPYALVGYKPMSLFNFPRDAQILNPDYGKVNEKNWKQTIGRGYQVWKKYESYFPTKKVLLIDYHPGESKERREMALISVDLSKSKIKEHLDDFCEVLERPCSCEEVFEILTHPTHDDFYVVMENDRLLGILLGFGRNNAYLYEQRELSQQLLGLTDEQLLERNSLQSFTNEWPFWPRKWRLPGFACDSTAVETKQLKKHYHKARKVIRWTYFSRDNLEVTLALLAKS